MYSSKYCHYSRHLYFCLNVCMFISSINISLVFPVAQLLKNLPSMKETWVRSLGWEDPLEKEMATHSSILAWRIPWMEEPGGLQSTGSQRVGHDWATSLSDFVSYHLPLCRTGLFAAPLPSQQCSCLRAFALALFSAWKIPFPDAHRTHPLT